LPEEHRCDATDPIARQAGYYYFCPADGRFFRTLAECKAHLPEPTPEPSPPPPPAEYTLTILVDPPGGGVTSPSEGSHVMAEGTQVRLTARPRDGFTWLEWKEDDRHFGTEASIVITMTRDRTFTAVFQPVAPPPPETGSLAVTVQDADTLEPIAGATVKLDGITLITDARGQATFEALEPRTYVIQVSYTGYHTLTDSVSITTGGTFSLTAPLRKVIDYGMWTPLITFLRGIWDLMLGTLRGLTEQVAAPIKEMVLGFLDQFTEAMGVGSPEERVRQTVKKLTEEYQKRLKELTEPIYKGSPELELAATAAAELLTALLGVQVTVEGGATVADQAQPFRRIGIPDVAKSMMASMGVTRLASTIATMPAMVGMITPLTYYWNKQFTPLIPSLPDLITMLVREVITLDEYIEFASWHGESEKWAQRRWETHWRLPAPGMIHDAYHRGIIDEKEWAKYLVWHDYKPEPRPDIKVSDIDIVAGLRKALIPRVDLRRAWEMGVIDDEELIEGYLKLGYEDDAELMAEIQKNIALSAERAAVARAAGRLYRDGQWTESEYRKELAELKIPPKIQDLWVRRYQLERLVRRKPREAEELA